MSVQNSTIANNFEFSYEGKTEKNVNLVLIKFSPYTLKYNFSS